MATTLREPTLQTLGLGTVLEIFRGGRLPVEVDELVDRVFGPREERGSLVISGANGIVGAGKAMQLGARLAPFDVTIVALDFPGAADGIGRQYGGLVRAFGQEGADTIMSNIVRLNYDGVRIPDELHHFRPRFLLEAIPEVLSIKRGHYEIFRERFPGIEIRSVTSGFPSSELGVPIAHPAFPHEINKVWETVEPEPSAITHLLWSLGLIPVPVSDDWSFILDVLFCGVTLAGTRFHRATNMPYWKIDKFTRKLLGPNPFRAHDAIGTQGATFLTWSCLHHLSERYGDVFRPTCDMVERKETGQSWYPPNHFRPLVDWPLSPDEEEEFRIWILGPLLQMTSLLLKERRGHLSHLNAIGELCAQFRRGILATARELGPDLAIEIVNAYHERFPGAAAASWYPSELEAMDEPAWQQLYVNAEHDGTVGVVSLSREAYNDDIDHELNRAFDWLLANGIRRVILSGDFHLATQLVGADTSAIYPALHDVREGLRITDSWSRTARRLENDFEASVGFIGGKRCLGGMLELMVHCDHLVAVEDAELGFPEVSLPIVPGVEGCHWPFRKASPEDWPKLLRLLLSGDPVSADQAVGWLVDFAGPMEAALQFVWNAAAARGAGKRPLEKGPLTGVPSDVAGLPAAETPESEEARRAIVECVQAACNASLAEALAIQSRHAAEFIASESCREGRIGAEYTRTMSV